MGHEWTHPSDDGRGHRRIDSHSHGSDYGTYVCSLESAPEILFKHDVTEVVVTRLDPPPQALAELASWLSDAERARAARFRFHRDCRRFIVARARLRQLLAERLDVPPESGELRDGKHGKAQPR